LAGMAWKAMYNLPDRVAEASMLQRQTAKR
jgi:hypothetical protein